MSKFIGALKKSTHSHLAVAILVSATIGILFYALNYYTPLYADDYSYSFSFSTGERIESIYQIVDSQIAHYQNTNGRSITHTLAQLFLLAGDSAFNFINVFFFLALIYLIYFHGCGTFKHFSLTKFSLIAILLFLSCPAFGQSFLWITGAANYLYGILIILSVLLPYRLQMNDVNKGEARLVIEIIKAIIYLVLGAIAGWTNENTSVAMIVMIIGYIALFRIKRIKIHAWNITGCIGGIVGCILMVTAPGTANRLDSAGGSGGIISWFKRMIFYSCDMVINLQLAMLVFIVVLILLIYQNRKKFRSRSFRELATKISEYGIPLIYLIGFMASVYSMIVSPQFPPRAWSGPVVIFLIVITSLCSSVDMSTCKIKIGRKIVLSFLLILCISTYINAFCELKNIDAAFYDRVLIIDASVQSEETRVEIPNICGWSGYSCYSASGDLNADSNKWPNTAIAKYYEIDEIISND